MKLLTSVEATIGYYNSIGIALTEVEVWRRLIHPNRLGIEADLRAVSLAEVRYSIHSLLSSKRLKIDGGYLSLPQFSGVGNSRVDIINKLDHKWNYHAQKKLRIFSYLPFIRAVFVSGSLAVGNVSPGSDIDVLIVVSQKRLWMARAFTTALLTLLGKRRTPLNVSNRLCLNHFLIDLKLLESHRSLYNAQTYINLVPIYFHSTAKEQHGLLQNNVWISEYVVLGTDKMHNNDIRTVHTSRMSNIVQKIQEVLLLGVVGGQLEKFTRLIQSRKIKKHPLTNKSGGRIIANEHELEFHPDSKEKQVLEAYNYVLSTLGVDRLRVERDSGLR